MCGIWVKDLLKKYYNAADIDEKYGYLRKISSIFGKTQDYDVNIIYNLESLLVSIMCSLYYNEYVFKIYKSVFAKHITLCHFLNLDICNLFILHMPPIYNKKEGRFDFANTALSKDGHISHAKLNIEEIFGPNATNENLQKIEGMQKALKSVIEENTNESFNLKAITDVRYPSHYTDKKDYFSQLLKMYKDKPTYFVAGHDRFHCKIGGKLIYSR